MTQSDGLLASIFAGPGTGKSTTRAQVFGDLKQRGRNVEEDPEYAKWLTWDERWSALGFQPYIFGKQAYRSHRLLSQVDAVITDTSVLYSLVYVPDPKPVWYDPFAEFVVSYFKSLNTLNIFLERDPSRKYNPKGRNQTAAEAEALDDVIRNLLSEHGIPFINIPMDKEHGLHVSLIADLIEDRIA